MTNDTRFILFRQVPLLRHNCYAIFLMLAFVTVGRAPRVTSSTILPDLPQLPCLKGILASLVLKRPLSIDLQKSSEPNSRLCFSFTNPRIVPSYLLTGLVSLRTPELRGTIRVNVMLTSLDRRSAMLNASFWFLLCSVVDIDMHRITNPHCDLDIQ